MLKYEHFIFDFDGTLSDSYPSFVKAAKMIADKYNTLATDEQIYYFLKKYSTVYLFDTLDFGEHKSDAYREFQRLSKELLRTEATAIKGTEELLSFISENGGRSYIYSHSGDIVRYNVRKWGLEGYFTDYLLGDKQYPRKPAPDALLALVKKHGLDPQKCVMVGDRDIDILAGNNAGMDGILIDGDDYYTELAAKYRIAELIQVKETVLM